MKRAAPGGRREGEAISVHKAAAETGGRESAMEYEFLRRLYASEALAEELLAAIIESDTWNAEQRNAPRMQKAQGELSAALDALGGDADERIYALASAAYRYGDAVAKTAILYGIRVAEALWRGCCGSAPDASEAYSPEKP